MKNFAIKLDWHGNLEILRDYVRGDVYNRSLKFDGDSITDATRNRLVTLFVRYEWEREEKDSWYESGYGYDVDQYYIFTPIATGGSKSAKGHLLYELLTQSEKDAEYERQLADHEAQS